MPAFTWRYILTLFACCALLLPHAAPAHEVRPAIVTMSTDADGGYELELKVNLEAVILGIGTSHENTDDAPQAAAYRELRALPPAELDAWVRTHIDDLLARIDLRFGAARAHPELARMDIPAVGDLSLARISRLYLAGHIPAHAADFSWSWSRDLGSNVFRYRPAPDAGLQAYWLGEGETTPVVSLAGRTPLESSEVVAQYAQLGFTHIVPKGVDHILFVLGLYLLSLHWRPLLYQVTAFTLAHTITLGLTMYGFISLSPQIVEPLIALSIVYVAVENIISPRLKVWRVALVFAFGLLHGMGFAGVLTELGLPRADFVTALISFNIGVELGQLAILLAAFLLVGLWFGRKSWYRPVVVIPGSALIALTGAYWTVERLL